MFSSVKDFPTLVLSGTFVGTSVLCLAFCFSSPVPSVVCVRLCICSHMYSISICASTSPYSMYVYNCLYSPLCSMCSPIYSLSLCRYSYDIFHTYSCISVALTCLYTSFFSTEVSFAFPSHVQCTALLYLKAWRGPLSIPLLLSAFLSPV